MTPDFDPMAVPTKTASTSKLQSAPPAPDIPPGASPRSYDDPGSAHVRKQQAKGRHTGPILISGAAEAEGATTKWINSNFAVVSHDQLNILLWEYRGGSSPVSARILSDKFLTKQFLSRAHVAVPEGALANSAEEALRIQQKLGRPVAIKPRFGSKGRGVTVNLAEPRAIKNAYIYAKDAGGSVLVEEYVKGHDYRCLASPTECASVVRRILPNVIGDGSSTIRVLIDRKNEEREKSPSLRRKPIPVDAVTVAFLARFGITLDFVPRRGLRLIVRDVGSLSSGGESYECSDQVGDGLKLSASKAIGSIPGLPWAGADIIVDEQTQTPYVLEINSNAAIAAQTFPLYGQPVDVPTRMWRARLASTAPLPAIVATPPAVLRHPVPLELERHSVLPWNRSGRTRMSDVFAAAMKLRGNSVESKGTHMLRVTPPEGRTRWFYECFSELDLAIVQGALRRHGVLRGLLRSAKVPRVAGRSVRELNEVAGFIQRKGTPVTAVPFRKAWDSSLSRIVRAHGDLGPDAFRAAPRWFVQSRPDGARLSVLVTPENSLALIAEVSVAKRLTSEHLEAASNIAVRAVRAVPGLRWAAVDLVIRADKAGDCWPRHTLVEGLSVNPLFHKSQALLAGSLDSVIDLIHGDHP